MLIENEKRDHYYNELTHHSHNLSRSLSNYLKLRPRFSVEKSFRIFLRALIKPKK